jgi:hypothetical protein
MAPLRRIIARHVPAVPVRSFTDSISVSARVRESSNPEALGKLALQHARRPGTPDMTTLPMGSAPTVDALRSAARLARPTLRWLICAGLVGIRRFWSGRSPRSAQQQCQATQDRDGPVARFVVLRSVRRFRCWCFDSAALRRARSTCFAQRHDTTIDGELLPTPSLSPHRDLVRPISIVALHRAKDVLP